MNLIKLECEGNKKLSNLKENYKLLIDWWQSLNVIKRSSLSEGFKKYIILFAYNSGNIENPNVTYHDVREVFEHDGVTSYTGDLRTLFEIRNAKVAMEYFFKAFREKMPFDETFIKELQRRLTLNTYDERRWQRGERPGEYKKGDYVTGRLAMNYLLALNNHPPLIIHQEDRKAYFEALEAWDIEQNLKPLKTFLLEQFIKTWAKRIEFLQKRK